MGRRDEGGVVARQPVGHELDVGELGVLRVVRVLRIFKLTRNNQTIADFYISMSVIFCDRLFCSYAYQFLCI